MAGERSIKLANDLRKWFPQGFPCLWGLSLTRKPLPQEFRKLLPEDHPFGANSQYCENFVRYFHTPDIWGAGDNVAWTTSGKTATVQQAVTTRKAFQKLLDAWCHIIENARYLIDITSLEVPAPDSDVTQGLLKALVSALKYRFSKDLRHPLVIRFLFGGTPQSKTSGFMLKLQTALNSVKYSGKPFCRSETLIHFATDYRGVAFRDLKFTGQEKTWNHSKIVAADGCRAITGGHNMNAEGSYTRFPVIHDLSVEVRGTGALLAHYFASSLWEKGEETAFLDGYAFDWVDGKFVPFGESSPVKKGVEVARNLDPGNDPLGKRWGSLGEDYAPAEAVMGVGRWGNVKARGVTGSGVQRSIELSSRHGHQYCSDHVKRLLIREAQESICISQQDLVSPTSLVGYTDQYHDTCFELGKRLTQPGPVDINVVVSGRYALDADSSPYSYGDSPSEAAERIRKTAESLNGVQEGNSCVVAPLTFCDTQGVKDHNDYIWPDAWRGFSGFFKGHVMQSHTWYKPTNGFGPGNHAKALMIDDALVLIGSDNMYPSPLAEFSFIIEGQAAVDKFKEVYWTPLWHYSERMGILLGDRRPVAQPNALVRFR